MTRFSILMLTVAFCLLAQEAGAQPAVTEKAQPPSAWDHVNAGNAKVIDGFLRIEPKGKQITFTDPARRIVTKESYSGPVEITVVARTAKDNIRLHAFNGAMVIFNWESGMNKLVVHRPDGAADKFASGSSRFVPFEPLAPNTWYTLRWRIQKDGMEVAVNDKVVFSEKKTNDLSSKQPIGVCALNSVVDVKSIVVKPLEELTEAAQKPKEEPRKKEETKKADPRKAPTEITADFLPHKPGTTQYYDSQMSLPDGKAAILRSKVTQKEEGIFEMATVRIGTLNAGESIVKGDKVTWLQDMNQPSPSPRYHRLKGDYIEIGSKSEGLEGIQWQPVLKIGAKDGDTWKWEKKGGTGMALTLPATVGNFKLSGLGAWLG